MKIDNLYILKILADEEKEKRIRRNKMLYWIMIIGIFIITGILIIICNNRIKKNLITHSPLSLSFYTPSLLTSVTKREVYNNWYSDKELSIIKSIANKEKVNWKLLYAIRRQEQGTGIGKKYGYYGVIISRAGRDYVSQAIWCAKIIKKVAYLYGDKKMAINPTYDFIVCLGSGINCKYKGYAEMCWNNKNCVWIKNVWRIYKKIEERR